MAVPLPGNALFIRSILLLVFCSDVLNVSGRINKPDNRKDMLDEDALAALAKGEPYFDKPPGWPPSGSVSSRGGYHNVSALIGKTAFLTCVVKNLGKSKSVTWIRHRDVHILTVGESTFTTDQRFMARHNARTGEWTLVVKYVQERDAGIYECQIPSSPKPRAFPVNLNIIVPHVRIQGAPDLHVDQGSVINLTCIISYSPEPPVYVFWYRGDKVVAYDSESGRVEVLTEKGRETKSHLVIRNAGPIDSGNYTCKPSIARSSSIKVHVLESEFPDALQESSGWSSHKNNSNLLTVIALLFNVGVASHLAFNLQVHSSLSKFTALAKT